MDNLMKDLFDVDELSPEEVAKAVDGVMTSLAKKLPQANLRQKSAKGDAEVWALCPFHNDQHVGSFSINAQNGQYFCFVCGAKGGLPGLVNKLLVGREKTDALRVLTPSVLAALDSGAKLYANVKTDMHVLPESVLTPFNKIPQRYIDKGHSAKLLDLLGVRYDHVRSRTLFPIRNMSGALVGIQSRAEFDTQTPRWKFYNDEFRSMVPEQDLLDGVLDNYETPRSVAFWLEHMTFPALLHGRLDRFVINEGMGHCLRTISTGWNVVAPFGTQMGAAQLLRLTQVLKAHLRNRGKPATVIVAMDGDEAGLRAACRIAMDISRVSISKVAVLPPKTDPEDLKPKALSEVYRNAQTLSDWMRTGSDNPYLEVAISETLKKSGGKTKWRGPHKFAHKKVDRPLSAESRAELLRLRLASGQGRANTPAKEKL